MTIIEDRNQLEPLEATGFALIESASSTIPDTVDIPTPAENGVNWEDLAACRTAPGATEVFFSEELTDIVEAKRICAGCPVIAPCLEGAIARAEPCGVWGGQLFKDGRILTQKRRRGRPPKVARPEDQLPVVPVPAHLQRLIA